MSRFEGLSVIIPTVNETTSLQRTVEEILRTCRSEDICEIILATADFATPACRAVCDKIQKTTETEIPIRIYVQTGKFENAIHDLTAFISGSHFIYQPADLEEDPRLLAEVIRLAKRRPDAIISGSRRRSGNGFSGFSPAKRALYGAWRILFAVFYDSGITDPTLLYRCMPSEPAKQIVLSASSYAILFELFLKLLRLGIPIVEFPVEMGKRTEGDSSTHLIREGLRYARVFFKTRFTPANRFLLPAEKAAKGESDV